MSPEQPPNRILIVAPQPFYVDRGTPIAVKHLIEALLEEGWKIDLLTYPMGETVELPGLRTFRIANIFFFREVRIGFSFRKLFLDLFLAHKVWHHLRRGRYSCIHAVEEAAYPAVLFGRRRGVPVIYDMQASLPEQMRKHFPFRVPLVQKLLHLCERWLIRNVDFVVCSAGLEGYARGVDSSARVLEWRFPNTQAPVSSEEVKRLRETLKIPPDSKVILYCGNFEPYQELTRLLESASKILSSVPNAVLVLVGGDKLTKLNSFKVVSPLYERKALKVISRQPRSVVPQYLAMADVLVSPRAETGNLPLKIFDYMAAGRPIVAIDCATSRTVLSTERAVLVNPSANELGEAIVGVLQDPERAERLGAAAQRYARQSLGWRSFVQLVSRIQARGQGQGRRARTNIHDIPST